MPSDEYYVDEFDGGINYYSFGNTSAEFTSYIATLKKSYTFSGTDVDSDNDTWYLFDYEDYYIDICYYLYDSEYIMDM
ncbi:MAG: hypothetical protein WCR67_01550 [Bacilli bacterium]